MITYSTRDMKQAGFIWAQLVHDARFKGLTPLHNERGRDIFLFNFEVDASREQFNELLFQYTNGETCVEPLTYNKKIGQLLDHLSNQTRKQ
jgi:hypothetical protein